MSHFKVNLPNPGRNKSSSRDRYQGGIPDIVILNPTAPLQVEDAVTRDRQADEQQGTAHGKPAAETKVTAGLTALSKAARVLNLFRDSLTDWMESSSWARGPEKAQLLSPSFQQVSIYWEAGRDRRRPARAAGRKCGFKHACAAHHPKHKGAHGDASAFTMREGQQFSVSFCGFECESKKQGP